MDATAESKVLLIYTNHLTARINYTVDILFGSLLHVEYRLISDEDKFKSHSGPKLCYYTERICESFHLYPVSLLFETGVENQQDAIGLPFVVDDTKAFYKTRACDFQFDVLAASFYLVSRYEEYLRIRKDKYGRFSASSSIAYKFGFLKEPIVHIWAIKLAEAIKLKYPSFTYKLNEFRHLPTIDIDNAWAYKNKGLRGGLMLLKSLLLFKFKDFSAKLSVTSGRVQDPFDNYDLLDEIHKKSILRPIYFFLVAERSKYDHNISPKNPELKQLIKDTALKYNVGLHPSYASNRKPSLVAKERQTLQEILKSYVVSSRQHYIKLRFPYTYRNLIKAGIKEDYSMGYASKIGFRAGICEPFLFFDVEANEVTDLTVYPFQIMDMTLSKYLGLRPSVAMSEIQKIKASVRAVGGLFVTLWHNESLSDRRRWKSWRRVYESVFD